MDLGDIFDLMAPDHSEIILKARKLIADMYFNRKPRDEDFDLTLKNVIDEMGDYIEDTVAAFAETEDEARLVRHAEMLACLYEFTGLTTEDEQLFDLRHGVKAAAQWLEAQ